jgi:hypothetical protein
LYVIGQQKEEAMSPPEDVFDQELSEFRENLRAMAQHQLQVLADVSANRLQKDLALGRKQTRWSQRLKRLVRHAKGRIPFIPKQAPKMEKLPDEAAVVVIEASYTVVTSESTPARELQEDKQWTP